MTWRDVFGAARNWQWTALTLVSVGFVLASFAQVGADWDWLVALGDHVRRIGAVPDGVPFAAADTSGWHNVPVMGEVFVSVLHDMGSWSVGATHVALVILGLLTLAGSARSGGAGDREVALGLVLVFAGSLSTLGLIRAQIWSLLLFPLMLALIARQARRPDNGIWWAPVLVAVWGNLHGAVLLGTCVLGAYLLVDRLRLRPAETVAVGVASLLALCLTPQLWSSPAYYLGVLNNVSATRQVGLWAPLDLSSGSDIALALAAGTLSVTVLRRRRTLWEYAAVAGLTVSTVSSSRHGIWLLFLLVVLLPDRSRTTRPEVADGPAARSGRMGENTLGILMTGVLGLAVTMPVVIMRGDLHGSDRRVIDAVVRVSGDRVVLAPAPMVEALAVDGVLIWAGNPLDAFALETQAAYLDFLDGDPGMAPAVAGSDVVVVPTGSATSDVLEEMSGFVPAACGPGWTCFVRN